MFAVSCYTIARYSDTGQMGCVHYGAYHKWFEDVQVAFLEKYGLSIKALREAGVQLLPIEMKSKYFRPAFAGDELEIGMCIREVSNIKATADFVITRVSDSAKIAQCGVTYVCTDETGRPQLMKTAMPKLYQALQQAMMEQV